MTPALRVTLRWLISRQAFTPALKTALPDLGNGDAQAAVAALEAVFATLNVTEEPGELGYHLVIKTEWSVALGPKHRNKFRDIVRKIKDMIRDLRWFVRKPLPEDVPRLSSRFEGVIGDVAWIESVMRKGGDDEIPHGDFTIIPMAGISGKALAECLEALDTAADHVRRKFPQVLYGKVYIATSVGRNTAASYAAETDTIQLSLRARKTMGDVTALCHEFGHRYEHKFFKNRELRSQFWSLSTNPEFEVLTLDKATRAKLADEFLTTSDNMRIGRREPSSNLLAQWTAYFTSGPKRTEMPRLQALVRRYVQDKDDSVRQELWDLLALPEESAVITLPTNIVVRGPLAVTPYGATKPTENFAEAFSYYVMGKSFHPELAAILDKLS